MPYIIENHVKGKNRPGLPGVDDRLRAFFKYVERQKQFVKPNLTEIARKILPAMVNLCILKVKY